MRTVHYVLLATFLLAGDPVGADEALKLPPVYIGGAFNMLELGKEEAAGWRTVRDHGAKLQVQHVASLGDWKIVQFGQLVIAKKEVETFGELHLQPGHVFEQQVGHAP